MGDEKRVRYLKIDRGRYFYQRRVPQDLQPLLGPRWLMPCGDVTFAKAVQIIVTQAEEHDQLIASLRTEEGRANFLEEEEQAHKLFDEAWVKKQSSQGLADDRRIAIRMIVRVLAYTAMRPIEVLRWRPEDVEPWLIRVMGSKNEGSDRVIPLHTAIRDFHGFIHGSGMNTVRSSKTDPATPVRHNYDKLIHEKLDPPITEPKQVLYSLRSTFQNATRRAGAPIDVRRAILGHKEA